MCSAQEWVSSTTVHPNAQGHKAFANLVINGVPAATTRTAATDVGDEPPVSVPPADGPEGQGEPQVPGGADDGMNAPEPGPDGNGEQPEIDQDPLPPEEPEEPEIDQDPLPPEEPEEPQDEEEP